MIRVLKNCDEYNMEWKNILAKTMFLSWTQNTITEYTPQGADRIIVNRDGTYTIEVNDLRLLIDNLRNGGVSLDQKNIKVVPSRYLNDIQGYNSIVLYRGWFCRVDSCGGVILCKEQEAYDRGLLAR